ncbi:Hypothetical protein PENO1_095210 [Penicillium occitanis (nom. inval.)]|nr:hypothetical protein PENOC_104790 [Penicillium occitanis (nom. inval.)]PCG91166.1 Hypothetical protein PENO1_095210 [Penicillium occitanis (nom. inval.)]
MADAEVAIRYCPGRIGTISEENWYHCVSAPNLNICSRCYHDYLKPLPFAANFKHQRDASGARRTCDFNVPRVHAVLREAIHMNDFAVLDGYLARRGQLPRCKGGGRLVAAEENFVWFQPMDVNFAGKWGACGACYEDYIVASPYSSCFTTSPIIQPRGQLFECDMAWPFCQGMMAGGGGDWHQIMSWVLYRRHLPRCNASSEVDVASRNWYRPRDPELGSLLVCEACYYDTIYNSEAGQHFDLSRYQLPQNSKAVCFVSGNIPLALALDETIHRKDWAVFQRAAHAFVRSPRCNKDGIQNGTWYSLLPAANQFNICQSCYACVFEARSAGHFLARVLPQIPGQARLCNLNIGTAHALSMYRKLDQAIDRYDASIFSDFARRLSVVPACPRQHPVSERRWYSHHMFSCCPSCWIEADIGSTRLSSCFSPEIQISSPLKCDFYSPRVRELWGIACAENDLPGFIRFMEKRLEIWKQTYPQIHQNLHMAQMNVSQQQSLFLASSINTGSNAAAAGAGMNGHYGNAQIGYGYETFAGAQGAMQFNDALSMTSQNTLSFTSSVQLEMLWKSVE